MGDTFYPNAVEHLGNLRYHGYQLLERIKQFNLYLKARGELEFKFPELHNFQEAIDKTNERFSNGN